MSTAYRDDLLIWADLNNVSFEHCEISAFLRLRGHEAPSSNTELTSPLGTKEEAWETLGGVSPRRRSSVEPEIHHCISKTGLDNLLSCFPEIVNTVDWTSSDDVLKEKTKLQPLSQDQLTDVFSRIDSGGDGGLDILDLKVWTRMLPLGRSEGLFVRDVMRVASTMSSDGLLRAACVEDLVKLCCHGGLDGALLSKQLELQNALLDVILGHNRFKTFADFAASQSEKQYHSDVELSFRLLSKMALCRYSRGLRLGLSSKIADRRKSDDKNPSIARRLSAKFTAKRPATHL